MSGLRCLEAMDRHRAYGELRNHDIKTKIIFRAIYCLLCGCTNPVNCRNSHCRYMELRPCRRRRLPTCNKGSLSVSPSLSYLS